MTNNKTNLAPNSNIKKLYRRIAELEQRCESYQHKIHVLEQTNHLGLLQKIAIATNKSNNLQEALQITLDEVCVALGWSIGHIYKSTDDGSGELISAQLWYLDEPERFEDFRKATEMTRLTSRSLGLSNQVLASGEPLWIMDVSQDPNFARAKLAQNLEIRTGLAVPVLIEQNVAAILEFFSTDIIEPDSLLLDLITYVGIQLSHIIERERAQKTLHEAHSQLEQRVEERTNELSAVNMRLKESERRFRDFAVATSDWFWETNAEHRFTWFSKNVETITGIPREWFYGKTREEIGVPEMAPQEWQAHLDILNARKPYRDFEFYRRGPNGGWVRSNAVPVFDAQGQFQGYRGTGTDITALREAQARTQAAQDRFMKAINFTSGTFALYDADDHLLICDQKYHEVHHPIPITSGLKFENLMRIQLAHGMIEDAAGREDEWLAERLAHFRNPSGPLNVQRSEGRWLQVHEERMPDGSLFMSGLDITEQKQAEVALRESEERLRNLVEGSIQGIYIQCDWKLQFANQAMADMLGYASLKELLAIDSLNVFLAPHERDRLRRYNADRLLGQSAPVQYEYEAVRKDGSPLVIENRATLINWQGRPAVQVAAIDVSERKRAETQLKLARDELEQRVEVRTQELLNTNTLLKQEIQEREQAQRDLQNERQSLTQRVEERTSELLAANEELAAAARAKDEFLASMSHELRTPLNAILGLAEMLQYDLDSSLTEQQRQLQVIQDSGQHLLALINDILDIARAGTGEFQLDFTAVNVESVCQASLQLVKQAAAQKRHRISTRIDSTVDTIQADDRRLKQILVNLLSNAVKFTPSQGEIGLEVIEEEDGLRFVVWDTGIGIASDAMKRLFKPFVQLDNRFAREHSGSGLGLSLVYHMVEMHGGSVTVESTIGKGSRFTVSLPWNDERQGEVEPPADFFEEGQSPITVDSVESASRALIIEDSPAAAEQLSRYLSELGMATTVYPRGDSATNTAATLQPDIILLDIILPALSGWDVLAQLKADSRTKDIPVIIVSVLDEKARGLAQGATDYLVKPVSRAQVHEALKNSLSRQLSATTALIISLPKDAMDTTEKTPSPLILLAEDNESNILTLSAHLQASGYRLIVARDGSEAIQRAREMSPDLILMDIQMPGMDGLEAIQRLRNDTKLATIPIIALTALAMLGDRERCLKAGADEYLSKPVSRTHLIDTIIAQLRPAQI